MRLRRLKPTTNPIDAVVTIALVGGVVGGGYALGLGWAGAAGVAVIWVEVMARRLLRSRGSDRMGHE
jgi:hypothetical protein